MYSKYYSDISVELFVFEMKLILQNVFEIYFQLAELFDQKMYQLRWIFETRLEKLHRLGAQLFECLASLGNMGTEMRPPPPREISQKS